MCIRTKLPIIILVQPL